ncbi:hypothetical protein ACU4GD_45200 [Cupriavidus basilensis]
MPVAGRVGLAHIDENFLGDYAAHYFHQLSPKRLIDLARGLAWRRPHCRWAWRWPSRSASNRLGPRCSARRGWDSSATSLRCLFRSMGFDAGAPAHLPPAATRASPA